jgi:hypothetical protein
MCVSVNKYKKIIENLQQKVYPSVHLFLLNINPDSELCLTAINELTNELSSLEKIENKLIFPSVLSLLEKDDEDDTFSPNIEQVIKLTQQKQDKIKQLFVNLFIETHQCGVCSKEDLDSELKKIETSFFEAKQQWLAVLHFLTSYEYKCNNRIGGNCACKTAKKSITNIAIQ